MRYHTRMKKILLILILTLSLEVISQERNSITLNWDKNNTFHFADYSINIPSFQANNFNYDDSNKRIYYTETIKVQGNFDQSSLQIVDIQYETITNADLGVLNTSFITATINATLKNSLARDLNYGTFSFNPIIVDKGVYKKVKSLTYTFSYTNLRGFETFSSQDFIGIRSSVLSNGDWFRFYVEKSGVYRISKGFLNQLGLNTNVDPRKIKIYGNGGRMLPLSNQTEYPVDLKENALLFIGEEDGVFGNEDYILFYAEGVDTWNSESDTNLNLYDNKSYYYITASGSDGARIQNMSQPNGNATVNITKFNDSQFYEKDLVNIGRLGRVWFGEDFTLQNSQTFDFNFPNIDTTVPIQFDIKTAAQAFTATTMTVSVNNQNPQTATITAVSDGTLYNSGNLSFSAPASENTAVQITYNNNGVPNSRGYLNYINVKATRNLVGYGKQFKFQNNAVASQIGVGEYQITNATNILQVWDITNRFSVSKIENIGQSNFSFKANLGELRQYIALDPRDYYTPLRDSNSRVTNQNLLGTIFNSNSGQFQDIDYLIITPAFLLNEAERLANFHRNNSQLVVKTVTLESIYPEFSSGKQDIAAIRNFIRYVYFNASTVSKRVKYVNLFGDTSFDYKNRIPNNTNIVPIFHSLSSNSLINSTMTDDFYAMMDDNEGLMNPPERMDLAVGRMLMSDLNQARDMVEKVIEYYDIKSYGRWRNNFTLFSDDVDLNWEGIIQQGLDDLGNTIAQEKPNVNVIKIHTDSYVQEASSGGERYPKAKSDILDAFDFGSLVFNYFGHGNEDVLAAERIFEKNDAQILTNRYKYPLFVTVTCEFTRFDNPFRPTAGEFVYWNSKGGAISLVTTTRRIGVTTGQNINEFFASYLYGYDSDEEISIAEALRLSKNEYGAQTLMVFYVGDPALVLAIPKPSIVLTKINNVDVANSNFVFNALSTVTLTGEIRDLSGSTLLSNYNGDVAIQILDKNINRITLANDNTFNTSGQIIKMNFNILGETIFRGNASVTNGRFEFSFVVPRDISIPVGNGRISFYAKSLQPNLMNQSGHNIDIQIGGINDNAPVDNVGPTVRLYMNDETFISGGITNENPIFLAFLTDENGINIASGIGHDIIAILDGDESNPFILNAYYETELNDYTKGKVRYPFRNLSKGLHTITFRAFDVYNNPVTAEIQFIVAGDETVTLTNVLNYPNPLVNYTQFWFTHNRPFEALDVQIQIMTVTGKIVKTINQVVSTEGFLSREISWDGKDDFGDKIGKGVYIYKLTVKSNLTNKKTEKIEKLVIL